MQHDVAPGNQVPRRDITCIDFDRIEVRSAGAAAATRAGKCDNVVTALAQDRGRAPAEVPARTGDEKLQGYEQTRVM